MPGRGSSQPPCTQPAQIAGVQGPREGHRVGADLGLTGGGGSTGQVGTGLVSPAEGLAGSECREREAGALGDEDAGLGELALGGQRQKKAGLGKGQGPILGAWPSNSILKMLPLGQTGPMPGWPLWWQVAGSTPAPSTAPSLEPGLRRSLQEEATLSRPLPECPGP